MSLHAKQRPLSPHLQVYKPQMTSMLSILHRMSGIANTMGLLLFTCWLVAAACGIESYSILMGFMTSPIGLVMMFGWTFSYIYHMLNGMRHLVWDTGRMIKFPCATKAGYVVFYGALGLTILLWGLAL